MSPRGRGEAQETGEKIAGNVCVSFPQGESAPRLASEAVVGASVWEEGEAGGPLPHDLSRSRKGAGPLGPPLAPSAADPISHPLKIA